jgi:hypothetical protein
VRRLSDSPFRSDSHSQHNRRHVRITLRGLAGRVKKRCEAITELRATRARHPRGAPVRWRPAEGNPRSGGCMPPGREASQHGAHSRSPLPGEATTGGQDWKRSPPPSGSPASSPLSPLRVGSSRRRTRESWSTRAPQSSCRRPSSRRRDSSTR